MADGIPIQCGDCGAHFSLDPGGDVEGAACSECGGKRFFRTQPSPTRSDGELRDMPGEHDPVAGEDPGGFPLGEGNIVGSPGSRGDGIRPGRGGLDGYTHSKVAMPREKYTLDPEWQPELEIADQYPQDIYDQHRGVLEGFERWVPPPNVENADPPGNWKMKFRENAEPNPNGTWTPTDEMGTSYIDPANLHGYKLLKGRLPQIPPELQGHLQPTLPEGEPPIEGHGTLISRQLQKVEPMNTLNMEPYEPLWHESYLPPKTAGPLMEALPAIGSLAARAMPTLMRGALLGGGMQMGKGMMDGGQSQQAGGMAPQGVTPAPSLDMVSKTTADIPLLLLSAMDTPHSVKSVGEQHDDPEDQDQKEFNDGDHGPSNLKNPNNDDSGAMGEDGVRDAGGFAPDSPAIERATMILPLLLHYFNSDESGQSDPLIRALHDALEQENPDYLKQEDPEGEQFVQQLMQHHKSPHGVTAGANAFPSGLPAMPGTGMDTPQGGGGAQGTCRTCGAPLAADGTCPQCGTGAQNNPMGQGGADNMGNAAPVSYPPNRVGTSGAGPQTNEQKQAVRQLLEQQGRLGEVPLVDSEPWRFHEELNQIQRNPNVAPLVDPSQAQPTPAPMGQMGMPGGGAPGAMPVTDPSQMGGGGGMPLQPMSRTAETYGPHTGWPRELPAPRNQNEFHYMEPGESAMGAGELGLGRCPRCGQQSLTPYNGMCNNCGFVMPKDSPDVALPQHDPQGSHTLLPGDMDEGLMQPRWGKQAVFGPRCPKCESGSVNPRPGSAEDTTTWECHSCGHMWEPEGGVDIDKYKGASLNAQSRVALVDVPNPVLENAAERTDIHPERGQDSSLIWKDAHGDPLEVGQTYDLKTAGMPNSEPAKIISRKPDELGVKLVGVFSNIATDQSTPDFVIKPYDIQTGKYSFVPSGPSQDSPEQPIGGMPGLEQIPQSGPTTDEATNSYPNDGTLSHVSSEDFDDLCHKCGGNWIDHIASSPTMTMHECARCGSVWETKDEWEGRQANVDLSWLNESPNDDFWAGMERAAQMREGSGQSRSIAAAVAKDDRYQRIKDLLDRNDQARTAHTAGRHFTPHEQRALVNERGTARNADLLDLTGTHYTTTMGYDPRDPHGRANEMNAPDSHLVLGL